MYKMSMNTMNTSADACQAPACQCASSCENIALIPDTAFAAVSLFVLCLGVLVSLAVRIILPGVQSRTCYLLQQQ